MDFLFSAAIFSKERFKLKRIGDLDVDSFYREVDFWGKRITDRLDRIEDTKESIWAIHSKYRVLFYWILSFFGVTASSFMVYMEWDKSWFEVFGVLWNSILGSVVIVWFGFQVIEAIMGAYTIISEWAKGRQRKRDAEIKKVEETARQKERDLWVDSLRKKGIPENEILDIMDSMRRPSA